MNGNLRSTLISLVVTIAGACPGWARTSSVTMPDTVKVDEVVVTGTNGRINSAALPYSVSVIDRDQLEATGETQVLSAISGHVPSLFVTERSIIGFGVSNGGSGHIKLRGVGGDRASAVLMMVDGQPQFAGIYSHHVADFYDKEWVDRVEVVRGPASTLYGSNAMGGVINVITRQAQKEGLSATLSTQYGSYNTWLSSMTATLRKGRLSSLLSLSYNRTDGNVDNFDYKEASGYGKIAYELSDRWRATADYTLMNFIGNDPIYPKLSNPESTAIYHQNVTRGEASLAVSNDYGRRRAPRESTTAMATTTLTIPAISTVSTTASASCFIRASYRGVAPWHMPDLTSTATAARYRCRAEMPTLPAQKPRWTARLSPNTRHTSLSSKGWSSARQAYLSTEASACQTATSLTRAGYPR